MAARFKHKTKGAKVPGNKNTKNMPIEAMPLPGVVWIALNQHSGISCSGTAKKGDYVKRGEAVAVCDHAFGVPIYASVSGKVTGSHEIVLPSGKRAQAIAITADEEQTEVEYTPPTITDHKSLVHAIHDSGMVGLGGAGFPTHVKFNPPNLEKVDTLLINAAECEPYLTADHRVMLEETDLLFLGIDTLLKYSGIPRCIIGIEDNKPEVVEHLLAAMGSRSNTEIAVLPTIYPQGAEKMLIQQVLNRIVPENKLPADIGTIVINVTTAAELGRYFKTGQPLLDKVITIDGGAIQNPKNMRVAIGTMVHDIVAFCGGYKTEPKKILMGGPMMGMTLYDENYPLLRNNNGMLFFDQDESFHYEETPCMACGRCTRACPVKLMPFHLKRANERDDVEALNYYKINLCFECGCCSYVCPARQELVQSHRMSKQKVKKEGKK